MQASSADMLMINFTSYNGKKMVRLVIKWATANEVGDWLGHVVTLTWDFTQKARRDLSTIRTEEGSEVLST